MVARREAENRVAERVPCGELVDHVVMVMCNDDAGSGPLRVEEHPSVIGGVAPEFDVAEPCHRGNLPEMVSERWSVEADIPFDHARLRSEMWCLTGFEIFGLVTEDRTMLSPSPPPRRAFSTDSTMCE